MQVSFSQNEESLTIYGEKKDEHKFISARIKYQHYKECIECLCGAVLYPTAATICDMIKGNESDVADIAFEILVKSKFLILIVL